MSIEEFEEYKFSIFTQIKFRGQWSGITEVWFEENKIGLKDTGHLIDIVEVEDIKD